MHHEPTLRLRRRQPRIIANLVAIAICLIWTITFLAWGLMPGPTEPRPSVTVPPQTSACPDPTVLSDTDCY